MFLQYFKKKENKYKDLADNIYSNILSKTKILIRSKFFKEVNFDSSFEIISIFLIFYIKFYKDDKKKNYEKINDELIKNFINDLDKTMREIGIGDISIGKYVKKYVKKFYYRVKLLDTILNNFDENEFIKYLSSIKSTDIKYAKKNALDFIQIFKEINRNQDFG